MLVWPTARLLGAPARPPEANHFVRRSRRPVGDRATTSTLTLPPPGRRAFVGEGTQARVEAGFASDETNCPRGASSALDRRRTTQDATTSSACLAEANRRAALGHKPRRRRVRGRATRASSSCTSRSSATRQDDPETPYKNIVALGATRRTLHHVELRARRDARAVAAPRRRRASASATARDITRTWVRRHGRGGAAPSPQLLAGWRRCSSGSVAAVAARHALRELHDESHRQIADDPARCRASRRPSARASSIDKRRHPRVLSARPRALARPATHDVGCAADRARADNPFLRNTSTIDDGPGLHHRARPLLHRRAARRRCARAPKASSSTGTSSTRSRRSAASASRTTSSSTERHPQLHPRSPVAQMGFWDFLRSPCPSCRKRGLVNVQFMATILVDGRRAPAAWGYYRCPTCEGRFRRDVDGPMVPASDEDWRRDVESSYSPSGLATAGNRTTLFVNDAVALTRDVPDAGLKEGHRRRDCRRLRRTLRCLRSRVRIAHGSSGRPAGVRPR